MENLKDDEPEIKLSVEMMVSNKEVPLDLDDARRAGAAANGAVYKVSSPNKSSPSAPGSPKIDCQTLAQNLSVQGVSKSRPDQWGLLTAISDKAKKRTQGLHIMLYNSEHVLGRMVSEVSCMFESPAVSGRHCTISRKPIAVDGRSKNPGSDPEAGDVQGTFVKDSSSNGTYINKEKLRKNGPEVQLRHGDILSLVSLAENESAFAFVFREVMKDLSFKRKGCPSDQDAELASSTGDGKRIRSSEKCAGPSEGPVSLDDVRRLQKSNEELRQQLEANVLEMEKMRGEFRGAKAVHLVELKEVRASVTKMYANEIAEIRLELDSKTKEVEESTALHTLQNTTIVDLNHRLASAAQSRVDAEEAIKNHVTSIAELKKRLDEQFSQHHKERVEWEANLDAAVERTRMEAAEELKRHSDAAARLQKQQQDIVADLQDADKANRALADSLRIKLEGERQAFIVAEEKGRKLGMQLQDERISKENACNQVTELQEELRRVHEELESEKEAKESAGTKVTSLELAMETSIRDLTLEKQRLQGARERIVLRETQLRTFYSTAAEVDALQQKQQEHLKVMLRTLEDGDGDGDYPESRNPKALDQSLGDEAKIRATLASRPTSSSPDPSLLLQDKGLRVHTVVLQKEKTHPLEGESSTPKAGSPEPDWMDGDTEHEDEDCLVLSNSPSTSQPEINGADVSKEDQDVLGEVGDNGPKVGSSKAYEETQLLQDHGIPSTVQSHADSLQEMGSSDVQAVRKESMGMKPRFWPGRRNSNLGVNAQGSIFKNAGTVKGGHGMVGEEGSQAEVQQTHGLGSGDANIHDGASLKDSVGTGTAEENDGLRLDGFSLVNVGSRRSGAHVDSLALEGNKEAATMCTDDLLTSEVAGSWALGTQASVHTGHEVGSHRIGGAGLGGPQNDTQLVLREQEATMCTDDLLASEVVGSWAAGTPASVHADNDSISSDEKDLPGPDEGGSQVVASLSRPPRHVLLDEVMHFADPVNSQNSLSPATTNPVRNESDTLNQVLDILEPGFRGLHGLPLGTMHQSDIDDSTTDGDEDENEVNAIIDGSEPLNQSPSVSAE